MPEILLYTDIQPGAAGPFREALRAAGKAPVVRVNSPGGAVFDGLAIANAITAHGGVRVVIDGLAASIASLIAISGRRVEMARNALLMIHDPWVGSMGSAEVLRRDAEALDRAKGSMVDVYTTRTGKSADEIGRLMNAETWFTAAEALTAGFIDAVVAPAPMAALDLSRFNNLPEHIRAMTTQTETQPTPTLQAADVQAAAAEMIAAHHRNLDDVFTPMLAAFGPDHPHAPLIRAAVQAARSDLTQTPDKVRAALLLEIGRRPENQPMHGASYTRPMAGDTGPGFFTAGPNHHHDDFRAAAIDALLIRGQVQVAKPHAAARDLMGLTLVQMADTMLSQRGRSRGFQGDSPLATLRAAMTTSDFPQLLADTAGKALLLGYEQEPASHRIWTRATDVRDFKPQSRVAVSEAPELLTKVEAAEYQAGPLLDIKRGPSFQLVTFGRMLILSREAMINDDLSAFTRLPMAFGAAAARKEADVVYGLMVANPNMTDGQPLFSAAHGNLMTGAALDVTGLSVARASMRKQKGPNGGYLNPVPRFMIVPAALETRALQLVAAERIRQTETTDPNRQTESGGGLEWIRNLVVAVDPRLDDDDPAAWYLAADFSVTDTCERVYLAGQRGVFTEENTAFLTDNFELKARLDFAATFTDWVGVSKTPAAAPAAP